MLESIYNIGGGKQQSPLARYLSSVGGAAGGGGGAGPAHAIPGGPGPAGYGGLSPDARGEMGQDGNPVTPPPSTGQTPFQQQFKAAGAGANPLGPDLGKQSFDYTTDPTLQAMLAGGAQDETDADAQALAARRSVLGQYGDPNLASSVLGAEDPTLGSVSDNPDTSTSTLARLKRTYGQTVHDSEDAMNTGNLFYGGARIKKLGDLAHDEQTQEADANTAVKQALDQIGATLGSTKAGIRDRRASAEGDAASRSAQAAILAALSGGLGGGSGGTVTTPGGPDVGAPTTTTGGVTYAGWPNQGDQIPTSPDTSGMTQEQAIAAQNAYEQALLAYNEKLNNPTSAASGAPRMS